MSTEQVFKKITGATKWYEGYCKHNTASMIKKRFNDGTISLNKINHLFNHFGYFKEPEQWVKK